MNQSEKFALVTGASSGIGYELSKLLAKDKYNLILVSRDQTKLARIASELENEGIQVIVIPKDLFNIEEAREIYPKVKSLGIELDVLVNDAGQGEFGKFIDNDLDRELEIVQLNISALLVLTKPFLRDMVNRGTGKILNLSSVAGKLPGPYQAVYHGTKAFVDSFTASVHSEVKDTGVSVTALLPGPSDTDFFHKADMESSKILDNDMADPKKVAKDGYEALMKGKASVISGAKNKMQVAMGNVMPDEKAADFLGEQQKPKNDD